jgi:hypothetical protein
MTSEQRPPSPAAEAADPATAAERLAILSKEPALRPIVAANPNTPPDVLEQLGSDRQAAVRRAVAQNPNAPPSLLLELAREFPHEFLANPIIPLLNLTQPEFIKKASPQAWLQLLRCEEVPRLWLRWLGEDVDPSHIRWFAKETMMALRLHVSLAGEKLDGSMDSMDPTVNYALQDYERSSQEAILYPRSFKSTLVLLVLTIPDLAAELIEDIYFDAEQSWQLLLPACYRRMSVQTWQVLARHRRALIRAALAGLPGLPAELLIGLACDRDIRVRGAAIANPGTPLSLVRLLVQNQGRWRVLRREGVIVRAMAACHPHLEPEDLERLAHDSSVRVRATVAEHPALSAELRRRLAHDSSPNVRCMLARNPCLESELLEQLVYDRTHKVRTAAAAHPQLPPALFVQLLSEGRQEVLRGLAANPQLPVELVEQLLTSAHAAIRRRAAAHPALPPERLRQLAASRDQALLSGLARNPAAPPEVLEQLAQRSIELEVAVSAHPHTPPAVLEQLATRSLSRIQANGALESSPLYDHDLLLLRNLAANPATPLSLLEQLLTVNNEEITVLVATHPRVLAEGQQLIHDYLLEALREEIIKADLPSRLRWLLLQRRDLPAPLLEIFANSGRWIERYLVARHCATPASVLEALAHDGNRYVRAAARERRQQAP